jgi:adenylylsulfate kinase
MANNNLFQQETSVSFRERSQLKKQRPVVLWFTGLSGSGKSTLASALNKRLFENGNHVYMLDGDNIRLGINSDLDFSDSGRQENIRRIAEIAKLFLDCGEIVLTAFVSPFIADREHARTIIGAENFIEVFVDTPLEECEARDVKGLYARARLGEIKQFTGIDSPYEKPISPEIRIETKNKSIADSVDEIYTKIKEKIKL